MDWTCTRFNSENYYLREVYNLCYYDNKRKNVQKSYYSR